MQPEVSTSQWTADRGANLHDACPLTGMTDTEATNPLATFVDSLLQSTGQLMLIVDHMARSPTADSGGESFDGVLRRLLNDVLSKGLADRPPTEYAAAATLLAEVRDVISDEIYLVDPEEPPDD